MLRTFTRELYAATDEPALQENDIKIGCYEPDLQQMTLKIGCSLLGKAQTSHIIVKKRWREKMMTIGFF